MKNWLHIFACPLVTPPAIYIPCVCFFVLPNLDLLFGQWNIGTIDGISKWSLDLKR